jgi:hypothetical protein
MRLSRIDGTCGAGDCPTVYRTDRGTIAVQGPVVVDAEGLSLSPGEMLVEIPVQLLVEAARVVGG